jgi:hypothetical protein
MVTNRTLAAKKCAKTRSEMTEKNRRDLTSFDVSVINDLFPGAQQALPRQYTSKFYDLFNGNARKQHLVEVKK